MKVWCICEWSDRFEVSEKGHKAKNGDELRAGPLSYIRLKVHGHSQGAGYRRMLQLAGNRGMEVFGIYTKLLELAGDLPRELRGQILNERNCPATIEDIAFMLGASDEQVGNALTILEKLGWIEQKELDSPEIPGNPGGMRDASEPKPKPNTTQFKSTETERQPNESSNHSEYPENTEDETTLELKDSEKNNFSSFSDSVSASGKTNKATFALKIDSIFRLKEADRQSFVNLADWLEIASRSRPTIFDEVIQIARDKIGSINVKNPIGAFFAEVKKTFDYRSDLDYQQPKPTQNRKNGFR